MAKYRKRPVVIEAVEFDGENFEEVISFLAGRPCPKGSSVKRDTENNAMFISTLEGEMRADAGDYIIVGVKGEIYPCKPDIFESTYNPV